MKTNINATGINDDFIAGLTTANRLHRKPPCNKESIHIADAAAIKYGAIK